MRGIAPILTILLTLTSGLTQAAPLCTQTFLWEIKLSQNPEIFKQVFGRDKKKFDQVSVTTLRDAFDKIFLKEMSDKLDYLDPKGRYNLVTQELFKVIPEVEYKQRLESGDLKPISYYVNEISTDALGRPLAKPIFPYKIINEALRTNQISPEVGQRIAELDKALEKLPSISGIVYRGTRTDFATTDALLSGKRKQLNDQAYTSTTSDLYDASSFLVKFLGNARKEAMPTFMIIQMTNGKPTSMDTTFAREEELLIPRGAEFEVVKAFKAPPIRDPESEEILYLFLRQKPTPE